MPTMEQSHPTPIPATNRRSFRSEAPLPAQDTAEIVGFSLDPNTPTQPTPGGNSFLSLLAAFGITSTVATAAEAWQAIKAKVVQVLSALVRATRLDKVADLWNILRRNEFVRKALSPYFAVGALTVAGYMYTNRQKSRSKKHRAKRVAVIGSGIAGCGAAWSLRRSGIEVVLYEKKPTIGGNAKAFKWNVEGKDVVTSLAVFAWPHNYFHSYNCLVDELGMETEEHDLRFFVSERLPNGEKKCVFAHGKEGWQPEPWLAQDLQRWESLCGFVRGMNRVIQPCEVASMYRMSYFNPLNIIPLRTLCRFFRISDKFWDFVFVPIHSSTFLEVEMGTVPAVMAEVLDDMLPFTDVPKMSTWKTNANDVVQRMTRDFPPGSVRTSCAVERVEYFRKDNELDTPYDVHVTDEDENVEVFDGVIFACSAVAMNLILHGKGQGLPGQVILPNDNNGLVNAGSTKLNMLNWLETLVLSKTMYTVDRDKTFERGIVHTKAHAVIAEAFRDEVLKDYCNYIEVETAKPRNLQNTFVISSWAPSAQAPDVKGKLPMLVSYNTEKELENEDTEWVSTSREAHPCLTTWQMMASQILWPMLQGTRNGQTFFCGSAVTPGNGHDLSFLSGLIVATELGAAFPFSYNKEAAGDYERLRKMMFAFWR